MAGGTSEDNPVGINVTAMVDIIFCLVLFFMCSLKFRELDAKLETWLPKDEGPREGPQRAQVDDLRLLLSRDRAAERTQRLFVRRPIPEGQEGDRLLERLVHEETLARRGLGATDVKLVIDSGPAVPWRDVIGAVDLLRAEPAIKISFATGTKG